MNFKNVFSLFKSDNNIKDLKSLWQKGNKFVAQGKKGEAEKLYLKISIEGNVITKHYAILKLLQLYEQNLTNSDTLKKAKELAKKDVELFPDFFEAWILNYPQVEPPYFPSFMILGKIYEEEGCTQKAIDNYNLALGYGVRDDYEESFTQKIKRLKKEG